MMCKPAAYKSKGQAVNGQHFLAVRALCAITGFALLAMSSMAQAGGMMRASGVRMVHVAPAPVHQGHRIGHIRQGGVHHGYHGPVMHGSRAHVARHTVARHPVARHPVHAVHGGHPIRQTGHIHHQRPVFHQPFPRYGVAHTPAYFHPATQQGGGSLGLCCNQGVIVVQPIVFPQGMGGGHHTPFIPKVDIPTPKVHRPFS
jgi:hypothetical protein